MSDSPLTLRSAVEGDAPALIRLAREAHAESAFADIPFSEDKVGRILARALSEPQRQAVVVAEAEGALRGAVHCSIGEYYIGTGPLIVTVHAMYVRREIRRRLKGGHTARGLLTAVRSWAQARDAHAITLHATAGIEAHRTERMARALGFRPLGGNYAYRFR